MRKGFLGVLLGMFLVWGSTLALGQCGSSIQHVTQTCGGHCGSVIMQSCQGVGTFCEDGTGDFGFGCCGLELIEPGGCQSAKAAQPREMPPTKEFLAFQDAVALRRQLVPARSGLTIASCGENKNAFNDWLEAKLRQRRNRPAGM
jgi:hypothetical protein